MQTIEESKKSLEPLTRHESSQYSSQEKDAGKEYCLQCAEVWGGIEAIDACTRTTGITACLFSQSSDGGKGGDIYYFSSCQGNNISRVALADVVGHGEGVSNVSQWLYESMNEYINKPDCSGLLQRINHTAYHRGLDALTTAAVFTYYETSKTFTFSYAGHHPFVLKRQNDWEWQELFLPFNEDKSNIPLGIMEEVDYDQRTLQLKSGDRIFAYTDGVIEARNPSGEFFSKDHILNVLNQSNGTMEEVKNHILQSMNEFTQSKWEHDDVTFMVVEIN